MTVADLVRSYSASVDSEHEAAACRRVLDLVASGSDPWDRSSVLHLTASALVVHRPTRRVLLRWHERLEMWAQVGGHGDPGESDAFVICVREAVEETGLTDVRPCAVPGRLGPGQLVQVAVVPVRARGVEPAHEHGDLRFLLETSRPFDARAESEGSPVRWLALDAAPEVVGEGNLREFLRRVDRLLP